MPTKKATPKKAATAKRATKKSSATVLPAEDQGGGGEPATPPPPDFLMTFDRPIPLYAFSAILHGLSARYPHAAMLQYQNVWDGGPWTVAIRLGASLDGRVGEVGA